MLLLPFERITYRSQLTETEVYEILHRAVESKETYKYPWSARTSQKPFHGKIDGPAFQMERVIYYRNSFLPQISGNIEHDDDGTVLVHVTMRLSYFVLAFLFCWILFFGRFFIQFAAPIDQGKTVITGYIPFLLLVGIYLMTMLGFKIESRKARKILSQMFEKGRQE